MSSDKFIMKIYSITNLIVLILSRESQYFSYNFSQSLDCLILRNLKIAFFCGRMEYIFNQDNRVCSFLLVRRMLWFLFCTEDLSMTPLIVKCILRFLRVKIICRDVIKHKYLVILFIKIQGPHFVLCSRATKFYVRVWL